MENLDLLENLGKIAGIAGISVGALVLIFGGIIRKNIFPGMTKEQGFRVIRMMIIAASVLAVFGIGAWVYTEFQKNKVEKDASLIQKTIVGVIKNSNGQGIPSVKISIARMPDVFDKSDSDGKFYLRIDGTGKKYLDAVFEHSQYDVVRKKVTVDFNDDADEIEMGEITMVTSYPPEEPVTRTNPGEENSNRTEPREAESETNPANARKSTKNTDITLIYNDEGTNCNLDIVINIGGMSYTPTGKTVELLDVRKGFQQYAISGIATCPGGGSCQVTGPVNGQLEIVANGTYYLVFDPVYTCIATILGEEDYNELMDAFY